jgi:hypothetical protein
MKSPFFLRPDFVLSCLTGPGKRTEELHPSSDPNENPQVVSWIRGRDIVRPATRAKRLRSASDQEAVSEIDSVSSIQTEEGNRKLILHMAQKMAKR